MRLAVFLALLVAVSTQNPCQDIRVYDSEDEFEDALDKCLAAVEPTWGNAPAKSGKGCTFKVNGDFGQPQPVYILGKTFMSAGDNTGQILVNTGDSITVACTGDKNLIKSTNVNKGLAECVSSNLVQGAPWLNGVKKISTLTCTSHPSPVAQVVVGKKCYNGNTLIRVGYIVGGALHPWYEICFDQKNLEVLYAKFTLNYANTVHQPNIKRPTWLDDYFDGVDVSDLYTKKGQRKVIASIVGEQRANEYIVLSRSNSYLARGHLAAKTDFVFASGQRSTFYYINAAPQWQGFNAGNWNRLEQNLRARIGQGGFSTVVYTGTFGVTQLRDSNGVLKDIYLHQNGGTKQLPVPMYFYKVVYDASSRKGTAFVGINNPFYSAAEARGLQFCTDHCRNNHAFDWLKWEPDRVDIGYSFCCSLRDFQAFVPHLPAMDASKGLFA